MLTWLYENLASCIVFIVLVGVLTAIVMNMIKNKKEGKSSCSGGCQGCPKSGSCGGF